MKYFVIFSGAYNFIVLKTMYTTREDVWYKANRLGEKYDLSHYDVLEFDTEEEMINYILEQGK